MVFSDIIVRTDCIDGKIIPICFQTSANQPCYNIERIFSTTSWLQEGHIEYKCRLSKSDKVVTLVLEIKDNVPHWLIDVDWDITKVSSKPVEEPVVKQETSKDDDIIEDLAGSILAILGCGGILLFEIFIKPRVISDYDYHDYDFFLNIFFILLICFVSCALFDVGVIIYKRKKSKRGKK